MDLDQKIQAYIDEHKKFKDILVELRRIIKKEDFEETLKWGIPTYVYDQKNLVGIGAFKNHVGLWFFQGALLKDKAKILHNAQEGKTKAMRQIHFKRLDEIDETTLKTYLQETITNQNKGLTVKISKPIKQITIPSDMASFLNVENSMLDAFKSLTPGRQKEYIEYIQSAKREKTKSDRLRKITHLIKAGKGLNDKYKSNS
jgi:uncharacterized protein YdeI (YjbR/CyaY-like superfamily)